MATRPRPTLGKHYYRDDEEIPDGFARPVASNPLETSFYKYDVGKKKRAQEARKTIEQAREFRRERQDLDYQVIVAGKRHFELDHNRVSTPITEVVRVWINGGTVDGQTWVGLKKRLNSRGELVGKAWENKEDRINRFIREGEMKVIGDWSDRHQLQKILNDWEKSNTQTGVPPQGKTMGHVYDVMNQFGEFAVQMRFLDSNPGRQVVRPLLANSYRVAAGRPDHVQRTLPLTPDQFIRMVQTPDPNPRFPRRGFRERCEFRLNQYREGFHAEEQTDVLAEDWLCEPAHIRENARELKIHRDSMFPCLRVPTEHTKGQTFELMIPVVDPILIDILTHYKEIRQPKESLFGTTHINSGAHKTHLRDLDRAGIPFDAPITPNSKTLGTRTRLCYRNGFTSCLMRTHDWALQEGLPDYCNKEARQVCMHHRGETIDKYYSEPAMVLKMRLRALLQMREWWYGLPEVVPPGRAQVDSIWQSRDGDRWWPWPPYNPELVEYWRKKLEANREQRSAGDLAPASQRK